ncbi:PREDICTED: UBP1-associated protein 2A-like [Ipomoea nil]|uniref:UBP1-associated protein 2A-like n=1 Tax=Ipomoea nil TaxID=35883 RepID=UPI000900E97A|nr:PREDICTED: UBP1-associated protein 2A-like [Ipomoea nil]XP_019186961.1 PREDICTED: UBP1-associated protein 2A-like [Ipomoea nil]
MAKKRKASSSATNAQPVEEEEHNPNEEPESEPDSDPSEEEEEDDEEEESGCSEDDEGEDEASKRESIRKLLEPFGKDQIIELLKQGASKDPSLLSRIARLADSDPTHRKLFVRGLSWDATTEQVLDAFRTYGEIEECKLITDKATGRSKGYAFVLFKTMAAAQKALKQPQKKIGNRTAYCHLAAAGPTAAAAPDAGSRKIYVANVGPNINVEDLHTFFSKFGEIEEGPVGLDPVTRKPRGFAIFLYKTAEGARKALEEPFRVFDGCNLYCKKYVENFNNSTNNAAANQPVQQSDSMAYGIGMNPGILGDGSLFMAQNPGMGLTANPLLGGNYGLNTLNPGMIGNYGSHVALHGLVPFQTATPRPASTPPNTRPDFGSAGASFPPYMGH